MNNKDYLVSICCITYNHEKYICDAIDGFLFQKANFNYEIIIADDCSNDNTENIVKKYISEHPKGYLIKYFRHEKNLGMIPNFVFALQKCKGKYIALCEGDDYWTNPYKLQKQIDFLENNSEYIACCHNVLVKCEIEKAEYPMYSCFKSKNISLEDLTLGNIISTLSLIFRNNLTVLTKYEKFFEDYPPSPVGDYILSLFLSEEGKIKYFTERMGVYRIHKESNFSSIYNDKEKYAILLGNWISFLEYIKKIIDKKAIKNLNIQIINKADELRYLHIKFGNRKKARLYSFIILKYLRFWTGNRIRFFISLLYSGLIFFVKKEKHL